MTSFSINSAASGIDVQATVDQIVNSERAPQRLLQQQYNQFGQQISALRGIQGLVSTLKNALNKLTDPGGALDALTVRSSSDTVVATASASATAGSISLQVLSTAQRAAWYSAGVSDPDASLAAGQITWSQAGQNRSVILDGSKTLRGVANEINSSSTGVSASILHDASGYRLVLSGRETGQASDFSISADSGIGFTRAQAGSDASITFNGVPITSSGNTLDGVIPGLTITISPESAGRTVTLEIANDRSQVEEALHEFVDAYNSAIKSVNSQFSTVPGAAGPLASSASARIVQERLLSVASFAAGTSSFNSLASIGIKMESDGTLSFEQQSFESAMRDPNSVRALFRSSGGIGAQWRSSLDSLTGSTSVVSTTLDGLQQTQRDLSDSMQALETRLQARRAQLEIQYSKLDAMLRSIPQLQAQISAQLGGR